MATFDMPTSLIVRGCGARLPETGYYDLFVDNGSERGDITRIAVLRTLTDGSVEPLFTGTLEEMPIEGVEKGATIRLDKAKEFPRFDIRKLNLELQSILEVQSIVPYDAYSETSQLITWYINLMEEMK